MVGVLRRALCFSGKEAQSRFVLLLSARVFLAERPKVSIARSAEDDAHIRPATAASIYRRVL